MSGKGSNTYFLKEDGTVWGIGANNYGQLGNGTTSDNIVITEPQQIPWGVKGYNLLMMRL